MEVLIAVLTAVLEPYLPLVMEVPMEAPTLEKLLRVMEALHRELAGPLLQNRELEVQLLELAEQAMGWDL